MDERQYIPKPRQQWDYLPPREGDPNWRSYNVNSTSGNYLINPYEYSNEFGLRGQLTKKTRRMLCVGCSFTAGIFLPEPEALSWSVEGPLRSAYGAQHAFHDCRSVNDKQTTMMIRVIFSVVRVICASMLLWALARHPYSYFQLLKVVATATCVFGVYCAIAWKKTGWAWIFGMLAVVFNPLISIALGRQIWNVVDVACPPKRLRQLMSGP